MSTPRILIVDDSRSARKLFMSMLAAYAECSFAENGHEAVHMVHSARERGQPYDVVLMDIVMPDMDGLSAVRKIRGLEDKDPQAAKPCGILMVTRVSNPENILMAQYQCGADGYIPKPFSERTVLQTIANLGVELPIGMDKPC